MHHSLRFSNSRAWHSKLQKLPEDEASTIQGVSLEEGLYRDLLGMSARLDIKDIVYTASHFALELIVVPCSAYPTATIAYHVITLDLPVAIDKVNAMLHKSSSSSSRDMCIMVLARLHHLLFVCNEQRHDLATAYAYIRGCHDYAALDDFHASLLQSEIAVIKHTRYHYLRHSATLEDAIIVLQQAVKLLLKCTTQTPLAFLVRELGSLSFCLYRRTKDTRHLHNAINQLRISVSLAKDLQDDRLLASCSRLLLDGLLAKFEDSQKREDLDQAITQHESIANLVQCHPVPDDGTVTYTGELTDARCEWLRVYNILLYTRFINFLDMKDLQLAIYTTESLVQQPPSVVSPKVYAGLITSFVDCLVERFRTEGRAEDLERVSSWVERSPISNQMDADEMEHIYPRGKLLVTAFERNGRKQDINSALRALDISVFQAQMMKWASHDIQSRFSHHLNAADIAFIRSAARTRHDFKQLLESSQLPDTQLHRNLISDRFLDDWLHHSLRLHDLGRAYMLRYECRTLRDSTDIEQAISKLMQAIRATPESSSLRWQYLVTLGDAYRVRYEYMEQQGDMDRALECYSEALHNFPPPNTCRVRALTCLGRLLFKYAHTTGDLQLYDESIVHFKEAAEARYGFAHDRLNAAIHWATLFHGELDCELGFRQQRLEQALEGYQYAIELLGPAASIGLSAKSRLAHLYSIPKSLARDAASCAISLAEMSPCREEEYRGRAVELLDQGRAILWSQASQLRADIGTLRERYPDHARRFEKIASQIEKATFGGVDVGKQEAQITGRTTEKLDEQWAALLREIRCLDGFHDFLRPVPFSKLKEAADTGPVVIVNVSDYRCDAIVISPQGTVNLVPLPDISSKWIRYTVEDFHAKFPEPAASRILKNALPLLWTGVCQPVLMVLRKLSVVGETPTSLPSPPRIRWCLTGRLAMLPIHAAGPRKQSSKTPGMLDWMISSYIPTLSIFLHARNRTSSSTKTRTQVLAVCHTGREQHSRLFSVREEVHTLRKYAGKDISMIMDSTARVDTVCDALQGSHWVHFACHGTQSLENPMDSALILDNGVLPVSKLAGTKSGEFAMLLACETAKGVPGLSDEAIHVAAGLHFAGFKSVIATMWSMRDEHGPIVANSVYSYLFRKGTVDTVPPNASESAQALRDAVLQLRDGDHKRISVVHWAPFIHFGV
ncbi:hypothetical protein EIP86_003184 [Pleurotus ostreatoroseus]|nr:hypothetical protein EIP86_003184 [Pleurotus ostreatoroseus]